MTHLIAMLVLVAVLTFAWINWMRAAWYQVRCHILGQEIRLLVRARLLDGYIQRAGFAEALRIFDEQGYTGGDMDDCLFGIEDHQTITNHSLYAE